MSSYKLFLGDCLDFMRGMDAGSVDAVITDPPYGIADVWKGGASHGWNAARLVTRERNEWDAAAPSKELFDLLLTKGKTIIIWGGNYFPLPNSRGWLVWVKPERGFSLSEAELAWTNLEMPIRVLEYRRSDPDREHPTQKPLGVMRWSVERFTRPGDTIFDPFMGSGTTGVACMQLGRKFIGCEIDPKYYAIAERRIHDASLQAPLFTDEPKREEEKQGGLFNE